MAVDRRKFLKSGALAGGVFEQAAGGGEVGGQVGAGDHLAGGDLHAADAKGGAP